MSRRIVWTAYESSEPEAQVDGYFDRLLKYIPADVVGLWLTGSGLIRSQAADTSRVGLLWLLFIVGLVFSFFWTRKQTRAAGQPTPWRQIGLSCLSFFVWVFAIGGPFAEYSLYEPLYGSLLLLIYTTAIPLLPPPKGRK
ncbi:hypothetical protein [Leptolyngbya sp. PCC 6406]|uniref:hypothetical protein n=1 Tax=Leptolyngbya sp. PCC 6406 TaxID=1173264 RepID=UPI0002ACE348|nr:hypothetical protein [Leptolyngbya sp. PCC 6406]